MSKKNITIFIFVLLILAPIITMACIPPPPPPPPPPPAECSPGFWKQPQHFQYWVGYTLMIHIPYH
jgi:hypothetical protein